MSRLRMVTCLQPPYSVFAVRQRWAPHTSEAAVVPASRSRSRSNRTNASACHLRGTERAHVGRKTWCVWMASRGRMGNGGPLAHTGRWSAAPSAPWAERGRVGAVVRWRACGAHTSRPQQPTWQAAPAHLSGATHTTKEVSEHARPAAMWNEWVPLAGHMHGCSADTRFCAPRDAHAVQIKGCPRARTLHHEERK